MLRNFIQPVEIQRRIEGGMTDRLARRVVEGISLIPMHLSSLDEKLYVLKVNMGQRIGCL